MKNKTLLILIILLIGILYRVIITHNNNFLFNMDNARDMVDVREMVILKKLRFTGPTSAIEGVFNGPAWYYLLALPFIISGGNPYASIVMEFILWAIGGFYLLKLTKSFGTFAMVALGAIWIASDYIVLTNLYAFNPNPITFLTPVFIYLFYKYLETKKFIFSALTFFLGGLFFNFEMNFGVFVIPIIIVSLILTKRFYFIKSKSFWLGSLFFILCLLPQAFFDLKHNFLMTKSALNFLSSGNKSTYVFDLRLRSIILSFYSVFSATLMNHKILTTSLLALLIPIFKKVFGQKDKDPIAIICLSLIVVPFILYLFIPVTVNAWHLGGAAAALVLLIGFELKKLREYNFIGKIIEIIIGLSIIFFAFSNVFKFFTGDLGKPSDDPSRINNEIAAIDYVYKKAEGKNFKVYTYLPSVIDYPYQYLIWWHGLNKFGYLPIDYAYSPNKPEYISNKESFSATKQELSKRENSNLVFLIKEPNLNYTRFGWEGDFVKYNWKKVKTENVGPLEIETRSE